MSCSDLPSHHRLRLYAVIITCLSAVPIARTQTQASCTFHLFQLNAADPTNPALGVGGVNDFSTVVGTAQPKGSTTRGFVFFSNGGIAYFDAPNSTATAFTARNNQGVSVGIYSTPSQSGIGFLLSGSAFINIQHPKAVYGTNPSGINKYNSVVGWYADGNDYGHGFKRWSNGSILDLDYPGTLATFVYGINDNGTVVGSYFDFGAPLPHGFIYHGGSWATLDFPKAAGTELYGISKAGMIIGHDRSFTPPHSFLYVNGAFKVITVPNSSSTAAMSISNGGLIAGTATFGSVTKGFTATCK